MLCVMTLAASAQVKSVDVKGELRGDFGLGIGITAGLFDKFELAPSFNYYFGDSKAFTIDADFHYDFGVTSKWNVYPIAGLVYFHASDFDKLGINLGVGTEYYFTNNIAGFVEGKYQWLFDTHGADDTYFTLGVKIGI